MEFLRTPAEKNSIDGMTVLNTKHVDIKKQPMFFGAPLGLQRYDNYKYPIFDKLTQQQLGYFWRPEEVSLQKDRADYQTLTPEQKHIFTSNLKYQVMLDSVQGRGPGMGFLSLTVAYLARICYDRVGDDGDDPLPFIYTYHQKRIPRSK